MAYKIYIEKQGASYPNGQTKDVSDGSLPETPVISTKIKPIDRDKANSEVEKGEIILDPETGALHKALGKSHSKGGTPVFLKSGSFIFSNYKDLAIKKEEKEIFEFKLGGKYKPANNTPSKVLEKEVDLEHHNKMIDILANEKNNTKESVNSAKLMMLKNLEKAGQVAYLQESKKGEQAPEFAQNSAPVYSNEVDEDINQSMQYLQQGGEKRPTADEILKAEKNPLKDANGWNYIWRDGRKIYYNKPGVGNKAPASKADQSYFNTWFAKQSKNFQNNYIAQSKKVMSQNKNQFGYMQEKPITGTQNRFSVPKFDNMSPAASLKPHGFVAPNITNVGDTPGNVPGDIKGIVDPTNQKSKLTPWQLINMGIPFVRALGVKTQYPLRQHQESIIPQLENINAEPQLNQNNQAYFNAAANVKGMNPNQGSAYMQQLFGTRIAANDQVLSNVQQANVQTQNQQRTGAAASLNQDAAMNRQYDLKYYDQTQTALKNSDELRQAYTQQGINNVNETMTKKLAFDSWLNTQQQYKGEATYIDKDGVQHYAGTPLYSPKAGFFGNSVQHNPVGIDWSTYQSSTGNKIDSAEELGAAYQKLLQFDPTLKIGDFLKFRGISNYNTASSSLPQGMKGGKFRSKKLY